jgi:DNA polymerase (family 10)
MKVELDNKKIAAVLNEISFYLKILNEDFKARAYERASDLILNLKEEISDIYFKKGLKGLKEIKGIGDSLALKIEELILKGESDYLKELKNKIPVAVFELNKVEGLGPKKIKIFYDKMLEQDPKIVLSDGTEVEICNLDITKQSAEEQGLINEVLRIFYSGI